MGSSFPTPALLRAPVGGLTSREKRNFSPPPPPPLTQACKIRPLGETSTIINPKLTCLGDTWLCDMISPGGRRSLPDKIKLTDRSGWAGWENSHIKVQAFLQPSPLTCSGAPRAGQCLTEEEATAKTATNSPKAKQPLLQPGADFRIDPKTKGGIFAPS